MNNYIVIENLNSGNFGHVKKIKNKYTDKIYAVKIESNSVGLLEYEAKIYNLLSGINYVPSIKSYKNDGENGYLIMDLMECNLKYFKKVKYSDELKYKILCKNIIISITKGLQEIHSKNIIHRDIKPENICIHNNTVKIIDFGLSKLIDTTTECKNITEIVGTPNYISKNVLNLNNPTKIDELESVYFIFLYLILHDDIFKNYTKEDINYMKDEKCIKNYLDNKKESITIMLKHLSLCRKQNYNNSNIYDNLISIYS